MKNQNDRAALLQNVQSTADEFMKKNPDLSSAQALELAIDFGRHAAVVEKDQMLMKHVEEIKDTVLNRMKETVQ